MERSRLKDKVAASIFTIMAYLAPSITVLYCRDAVGQGATASLSCNDFDHYRRIVTAEPSPPNAPMRRDNITDDEVREVQKAALDVYPDAIVSISGVTEGCGCEDGIGCTAQVWLALEGNGQTRTLVLSKIDGHWKMGAVQRWWLQYHAHQVTNPRLLRDPVQVAWNQENQRLLDAFPSCPVPVANWTFLRESSLALTCIDKSSLRISDPIRRVKIKVVGGLSVKRLSGAPYLRYTISDIAYDCKDHRYRIDQWSAYYSDGHMSENRGVDAVLWDPARPDTSSAADLDLVCHWSTG